MTDTASSKNPSTLFTRWPVLPGRQWLAAGLILIALASSLRYWIAPALNQLPADYTSETLYAADVRFRTSPTAEWQAFPQVARRIDQALTVSGKTAIILGEMHWTAEDGQPTFVTTGLYGVHRRTRMNLSGYGNQERHGQYLFPNHLKPGVYEFWDPFYIGPGTATFKREDQMEGLKVQVYDFTVTDSNDTAGYTFLQDVPERYETRTNGDGTLWIEPVSGIVVDFEDRGITYFVNATTGERVAEFYIWQDGFAPETKASQMALARQLRLRIIATEVWGPGTLAILGLLCIARAGWKGIRRR